MLQINVFAVVSSDCDRDMRILFNNSKSVETELPSIFRSSSDRTAKPSSDWSNVEISADSSAVTAGGVFVRSNSSMKFGLRKEIRQLAVLIRSRTANIRCICARCQRPLLYGTNEKEAPSRVR